MTATDAVVDAQVVEENGVEPAPEVAGLVTVPTPPVAVTPAATAEDLSARLAVIQTAAEKAMVVDVDYGKIPGTEKDCLFKPGAEKLAVLFQLDIQLENEKHFDGDHLTVVSKATAYHAPTGTRVGFGEGMCSSREKKYAKRIAKLKCPECGAEQVNKSKHDPGFYCWAKKGGCGAQFGPDDTRITGQERGEVENPDLPDTWNTVLKMAEKRARVDAVLAVTGASALFTQDIEDQVQKQDPETRATPDPEPPSHTAPASDPAADEVFDKARLLAACDKVGLSMEQKGRIGDFIGVTKDNDWGGINPWRLEQCIRKIEAGDAKGLGILIGRDQ